MKLSPAKLALVEAVKAHALAHYNDGGWDVIVECWDDEMIAETIGAARTEKGALAKFAGLVDVWADRQADARVSSGEASNVICGHCDRQYPTLDALEVHQAFEVARDARETERAEAKTGTERAYLADEDEALAEQHKRESEAFHALSDQEKSAESDATATDWAPAYVDHAQLAREAGANGYAAAPMYQSRRLDVYGRQNGAPSDRLVRSRLTPRQARRVRKHDARQPF